MSTYNKHKNEQLDKKPAIFCFRQVVDKRPRSGQGLYRPWGCKKGLNITFIPEGCTLKIHEVKAYFLLQKYTYYTDCLKITISLHLVFTVYLGC